MGIWATVKSKAKEIKEESAYRKAASKQIKKQATAAYYQASAKERVKFAQAKAKIETEQKIKKLKASYARKPMSFRLSPALSFEPSGMMSPSSAQLKVKKVKRRKKRRRK